MGMAVTGGIVEEVLGELEENDRIILERFYQSKGCPYGKFKEDFCEWLATEITTLASADAKFKRLMGLVDEAN